MAGLQLGGMVSGMDTSTIIQQLLLGDTDKIKTKQTKIEDLTKKKNMWTDIKIKMMELKYASKDLTLTSTFMTKEAKSSESSKVTAISKPGSANATYNLTNVVPAVAGKEVGDAISVSDGVKAKISGTVTWPPEVGVSIGNKRFNEYTDLGLTEGSVTINGASITISNTDTLNLVATKINGSSANVKATVDSVTGQLVLEAKNAGDTISIDNAESNFFTKFGIDGAPYTEPKSSDYLRTIQDLKNDGGSTSAFKSIEAGFFTLNGFTFEVKETDTVSSIIKNINSSEAGVNAVYDSTSKRFTFAAKTAGESIVMENDTSNFLHAVGVMGVGNTTETYAGTASSYTLNGIAMTGATNDIEIDGTTITLRAATEINETVTVNVTNNGEKALEKIKSFVEKYNAIVDLIETNMKAEVEDKTDENLKKDSNYKSNTVSKGLLNGDSSARQILFSLRRSLTEQVSNVDNAYNQLALIGINASDNQSSHLTLDEETLKKALNDNPDEVFKLFSNSGKEKTKTVGYATGSAATISTNGELNLGLAYSGSTGVAVENRTFSDYSSGVTSGTMKINGVNIYVGSSENLTTVINKINASTAGVTASFSSGKLTITSNDINKNISLEAGTTTFLYKTGILQETNQYDGISARLENYLNPMTKYQGTLDSKKTYYTKSIDDMQEWITGQVSKIEAKQQRYVKMFAAMEKAMNTANSQSSWLSSQLSSLG